MKSLIRRLARVADSTQYHLLRSELRTRRRGSVPFRKNSGVPEGHLPVYVGEEMERFVVSAELLNHPIFVKLLNKSAQEYGYEQKGVLRIPCHVFLFERVLEALSINGGVSDSSDLQDILSYLSDEFR
ncbi:auxin-responsive protein SAUR71-like [Olea europaea var. sylvestris]|uniref:Auxin-responsive SAUR71-like n=1 Tax=Olea europaea subsp. europaea TaxID=158383 RepID=A0A8S0SKU9_OLEEU|nr:auxin-responsive protein SAUR71-like [Olea europaea var. sylvestris]CAA2993005.1 auxin-responsive SAUR71-like [Olea europaea subsp. europaea]